MITSEDIMQTQILKVAMMAALLACAIGIAAFARGAYEFSLRTAAIDSVGSSTR